MKELIHKYKNVINEANLTSKDKYSFDVKLDTLPVAFKSTFEKYANSIHLYPQKSYVISLALDEKLSDIEKEKIIDHFNREFTIFLKDIDIVFKKIIKKYKLKYSKIK